MYVISTMLNSVKTEKKILQLAIFTQNYFKNKKLRHCFYVMETI